MTTISTAIFNAKFRYADSGIFMFYNLAFSVLRFVRQILNGGEY